MGVRLVTGVRKAWRKELSSYDTEETSLLRAESVGNGNKFEKLGEARLWRAI